MYTLHASTLCIQYLRSTSHAIELQICASTSIIHVAMTTAALNRNQAPLAPLIFLHLDPTPKNSGAAFTSPKSGWMLAYCLFLIVQFLFGGAAQTRCTSTWCSRGTTTSPSGRCRGCRTAPCASALPAKPSASQPGRCGHSLPAWYSLLLMGGTSHSASLPLLRPASVLHHIRPLWQGHLCHVTCGGALADRQSMPAAQLLSTFLPE